MTIEERVAACVEKIGNKLKLAIVAKGYIDTVIEQALRDQIEACAKVGDKKSKQVMATSEEYERKGDIESALRMYAGAKAAEIVAHEIRALANKTEQTEGKDVER